MSRSTVDCHHEVPMYIILNILITIDIIRVLHILRILSTLSILRNLMWESASANVIQPFPRKQE
jgi:hypothetical protein